MTKASLSWDTLGPFLVWQFLIPLVRRLILATKPTRNKLAHATHRAQDGYKPYCTASSYAPVIPSLTPAPRASYSIVDKSSSLHTPPISPSQSTKSTSTYSAPAMPTMSSACPSMSTKVESTRASGSSRSNTIQTKWDPALIGTGQMISTSS